jgi:hypothetical protein
MIQVERSERSLVHSERSRAPKPGSAVAGETVGSAVVATISTIPFNRELAGWFLNDWKLMTRTEFSAVVDTVACHLHERGFQARPLRRELI